MTAKTEICKITSHTTVLQPRDFQFRLKKFSYWIIKIFRGLYPLCIMIRNYSAITEFTIQAGKYLHVTYFIYSLIQARTVILKFAFVEEMFFNSLIECDTILFILYNVVGVQCNIDLKETM